MPYKDKEKAKEKAKEYREINKEKQKEYIKNWQMSNDRSEYKKEWYEAKRFDKYGITKEYFEGLLKAQDHSCKICSRKFTERLRPYIDHCHNTLIVRGLLCMNCNTGLGHFKDNTHLLANAINYLLNIYMTKILVLPDFQIKPEDDLRFIERIGLFIVDKKPDVIVHLGDFADMQSLSSYDVGKKAFEGRTYKADIDCAETALIKLFEPLTQLQLRQHLNRKKVYQPRTIITVGNHEQRILKAINSDRKLEGLIGMKDLNYNVFFDEVYPFQEVVVVDGVAFSHYFTTGQMGRPCSSAVQQLNKKHMSCVSGHQQGLQIATGHRADGKRLTSIIAGSAYEHDEGYMGPQGNKHWRGVLMLHDVKDGEFDMMPVSLDYLKDKYK